MNFTTPEMLRYATAGADVLKAVELADTTITFENFVRSIGLLPQNAAWSIGYLKPGVDILNFIYDADKRVRGRRTVHCHRVVNAKTGQTGKGYYRKRAKPVQL